MEVKREVLFTIGHLRVEFNVKSARIGDNVAPDGFLSRVLGEKRGHEVCFSGFQGKSRTLRTEEGRAGSGGVMVALAGRT